jgi:two-component system response regulator FixJ
MDAQAKTIAIVDDDAAVCDSTRYLLEAYGFDVRTYPSGTAFLRESSDVLCVIVDYQMPDLDGLDFVSELRQRGRDVPAIMVTATNDPKVERQAAGLQISQVLKKPLFAPALLRAIRGELETNHRH